MDMRRGLAGLAVTVCATAGMMTGTMLTATSASGAAAELCGYPPAQCTVSTDKGTYHKGGHVGFHVGRHAFNSDGKVHPSIKGKHYHHAFHTKSANANGAVNATVKLPKHMPKGTYKFILKGHKHGHDVKVVSTISVTG